MDVHPEVGYLDDEGQERGRVGAAGCYEWVERSFPQNCSTSLCLAAQERKLRVVQVFRVQGETIFTMEEVHVVHHVALEGLGL